MRAVFAAAFLCAAPAIALAEAPEQFDLDCVGAYHNVTSAGYLLHRRYHLDLSGGRWCYDQCAQPKAFTSVTPDMITLEKLAARDNPLTPEAVNRFINRQTGGLFDSDGGGVYFQGTCTKAPFTPLPEPKF